MVRAKEKMVKEKEENGVRRKEIRREMAGIDHVSPVPLLLLAYLHRIVNPSLKQAFARTAVRPPRVVPAGPRTTIQTPWNR